LSWAVVQVGEIQGLDDRSYKYSRLGYSVIVWCI